ncbi:MAG: hypothetical protein AB7K86_11590 [Rhodospirillales bacterium]
MTLAHGAMAGPLVFSAAGADAASIQAVVDAFRAALGSPDNGNAAPQPAGRREINWDGGGAAAPAATFATPMTTFASRGATFATPGTGFEISGQPSPEFGDLNPAYPGAFATFSATRLFAPLDSNVMDVLFHLPGAADVAAATRGFGAVFTDIDLADTTTIEFYDPGGESLGSFAAPVAGSGLSFLGIAFNAGELVSRVRITLGNAALGADEGAGVEVVALDDFIYGEPQLVVIHAPAMVGLLGIGGLWLLRRRPPHRQASIDTVQSFIRAPS